jgi:hypothetical protein
MMMRTMVPKPIYTAASFYLRVNVCTDGVIG